MSDTLNSRSSSEPETEDEVKAWVKREAEQVLHICDFLQAGLAVRRAGLIYFLPLCHDAYGGNY